MLRRASLAAWIACAGWTATAQAQSLSAQESFRIGSATSGLCSAQTVIADRGLADMFDRGYTLVCRDAAVPVGKVYALRVRPGDDPLARLAALRSGEQVCQAGNSETIDELGQVETLSCRLASADVGYRVYVVRHGRTLYVAEGLAGYDSALRLALRSVVADRVVEGEVSIATTGAGDPAAFARVQAGALDRQRALAEAYRRNNAGSFAEAAEFFSVLTQNQTDLVARAEAVANEALQKSNLGRYAEADALFAQVDEAAASDPVIARRLRNYRTIHLLNQGLGDEALAELDRPVPSPRMSGSVRELVIDRATASRLSTESPGARALSGAEGLSPEDKAQILDGQALQLRGVVLRLQGRDAEAVAPLTEALDQLVAIRGGRIAATLWLRAQILGDLAEIAEARGDLGGAETEHRVALGLLETNYPSSAALFSAKGRLAAFYARNGRADEAIALFREIVAANAEGGTSSPALRRTLDPYFELLAARGSDPAVAADLFAASQVLVRPGVAQTQALFARELSGGSDEAARLFRQSVTLTRDIERARVELARIEAGEASADGARTATLRTSLEEMQRDQAATQARLNDFPRYRVVAGNAIALSELQQLLAPGEAYYKMIVVSDDLYGLFATSAGARAFRIPVRPAELERQVDALRATITILENGQQLTYPFNVELAHQLYQTLFAPIDAELRAVTHLVFEPDGAMLRLPANLLVMDRAGVDAYRTRVAASADNEFDFRGVEWLGRGREISTAVSARSFRDVRQAPPSQARSQYLGLGENAPAEAFLRPGQGVRAVAGDPADCAWSLAAWSRPISAAELQVARRALDGAGSSEIVTGASFSDTAIMAREDLNQFRILHFATHGLVTAPRPECPSRPALLTSFGGAGSDGLLTFREIFDLRLDADLIVLSACDTAGRAGLTATQEAGLTSGGDFALDGLVRAFVGAGGRMVVASHWPVPDDYNATQRLISGLFTAAPGTSAAAALRRAEMVLMDDADTSHPYYWSGFAIIGDGAAPVIRAEQVRTASAD
jgi:CHAT domain-containing protein